jgi:hypothetical protein
VIVSGLLELTTVKFTFETRSAYSVQSVSRPYRWAEEQDSSTCMLGIGAFLIEWSDYVYNYAGSSVKHSERPLILPLVTADNFPR